VTAKPAQALPKELLKLRALLQRGLDETASLWPDIACAFGWVQQAARVLENPANQSAEQVHRRYRGLLGAMRRWRSRAGAGRGSLPQGIPQLLAGSVPLL
jgi:hypothetical protein